MNTKSVFTIALLGIALAVPALADETGNAGNTVIASAPGSAMALRTLEVVAQIVSIDKAARKVSLKKSGADSAVDVIAGDDVRNFDQIRVGDLVRVRYVEALALELQKTKGESSGVTMNQETARAPQGQRPGGGVAYEVSAIADVVDVDQEKSTITLKGPLGNTVPLAVHNPEQFKVVKKGDQVAVTYTQAIALSVEPAPSSKPNQ